MRRYEVRYLDPKTPSFIMMDVVPASNVKEAAKLIDNNRFRIIKITELVSYHTMFAGKTFN